MICYRDRVWCSQTCGNLKCDRNLTLTELVKASRWWDTFKPGNKSGPPIDQIDMKDSKGCTQAGGYMETIEVEVEEVLMIQVEPPESDKESKVWTEPGGLKS